MSHNIFVDGPKLLDAAVTTNKLLDDSVTTGKLVDTAGGILKSSSYPVAADYTSTANLYGWYLNGASGAASLLNWIGGKNFTVGAGALTSQVDYLGNTVYCGFDGSTYLTRGADATFNMNGSFSIEFEAYHANWASISTAVMPISCVPGAFNAGWYVGFDSNGMHLWTAPTTTSYGGLINKLAAGWHHFAVSRTTAGNTYFYIDKKWTGTVTSAAFTAGGNLEIGSGGGGGSKFTGRIGRVGVDTANAWTENDVAKLYARSARRFAALDQNGAVQIPQNELIEYPIRKLIFSSTPAGWDVKYGYGRPSKDASGNWYFEFWMRASFNPITGGTFTINGITAKATTPTGQDQTCAAYGSGLTVSYCEVGVSSGVIYFGFSGGSNGALMVYGKIMLENAPAV